MRDAGQQADTKQAVLERKDTALRLGGDEWLNGGPGQWGCRRVLLGQGAGSLFTPLGSLAQETGAFWGELGARREKRTYSGGHGNVVSRTS